MAAVILVGKAPLTTIRHDNGTRSNLPQGAIVPNSIDPADAARLLAEGYLEEIEVVQPEAELVDVLAADDIPTTPAEIKAIVGADPVKAEEYLALEMAKAKPRPSLVAALEKVIDDGKSAATGAASATGIVS